MKKIFIITGISILSILNFASCGDDFLKADPTVDIPVEDFYTSEERLLNSLMAAYQPLLWHDWAFGQYNPIMLMGDIMGEDILPGGADAHDNEHWHRMNTFKATGDYVPSSLWLICYSGVNRANTVIANIEETEGVSASVKKRVYAEALTLRAYYYHILWKFWGNIPYFYINPDTSPFLVDQVPADEVYKHIVADLDLVLKEGALPLSVKTEETGRLTKAAAQMLRANIVTYQNDTSKYPVVLADMKEIINSHQFSLYSDFSKLWEVEGEWCSESIFEVVYTDNPSTRTWDNPLGAGGCVTPTLIGISGLGGSDHYNSGWGFGIVSKSIYDIYEARDQRKDGGILNFDKYKQANPTASYKARYQDTGFFIKKYLPRKDGNTKAVDVKDLNYNNNYRVFRFAETLLLASELIVRTGGAQSEADTYLNTVRARAYKMDINDAAFAPFKKTATLDNILQENRLEFVGEGHRFWDLVRFGKAEQVLGSKGYTVNKKHLPIPRGEIDKAQGTLTQNPY